MAKVGRRTFFKVAGLGLGGVGLSLGGLVGLQKLMTALANAQSSQPQPLAIACEVERVDCISSYTCTHQGTGDSCVKYEFWCQNFTCQAGPDFVCSINFRCPDAGSGRYFRCLGTDPGLDDFQFECRGFFSDYTDTKEGCTLSSQFVCDDFRCTGTYVK